MTWNNPVTGVIVFSTLLAGCISSPNFPAPPDPRMERRSPLASADADSIKKDYAQERIRRGAPRIGLALSGGGTRAGVFAFGVLNGLNDTKLLDQVDVISSVSGGGYAAYWLFARRLDADQDNFKYQEAFEDCRPDWWVKYDKEDKEVNLRLLRQNENNLLGLKELPGCNLKWSGQQWTGATDDYRWQAQLARYPDVFRRSPVVFNGENGSGPSAGAFPVALATVLEVLRFPFVPDSYLGRKYEEGISRTWGLTPEPRLHTAGEKVEFANADTDLFGGPYVKPGVHTWEKLRQLDHKLLQSQDNEQPGNARPLPLWIINTTVLPKQNQPDERSIFELTPFSYGSEASGYLSTADYPDMLPELPGSVRASAAAGDFQGFGTSHWREVQWVSTVLPAARWGVNVKDHPFGEGVGTIRLSDGGGSDNLGLISLVRRGIPDIILVDAEADIEGRFEGLCWDREILNKAGYDLTFPMLEDFSKLCAQRIAEREGNIPADQRAYNVSAWNNPVLQGSIVALKGNGEDKLLPAMNVWLIKLAWNQEKVHSALNAEQCETQTHPVSCMLTVYHAHQTYTDTELEQYQLFPHLSTMGATWNASTPLLWAWRELGRSAASQLQITGTNGELKVSLKSSDPSPQKLLFRAPDRQAVSIAPSKKH